MIHFPMSNKSCCCCIFIMSNGIFFTNMQILTETHFNTTLDIYNTRWCITNYFFWIEVFNWPIDQRRKSAISFFKGKVSVSNIFLHTHGGRERDNFLILESLPLTFTRNLPPRLPTYFQTKLFRSFSSLSRIAFLPRSISLPLSMFCRPTFAGGSFEALIHTRPISVKLMQHCLLFVWNVLHFQATIFCCPFPNF